MLKHLTKKQVHSLLNLLDVMSTLEIAPAYSIIWEYKQRTTLDLYWNITREDPSTEYAITIKDELGTLTRVYLNIRESDA